MSIGLKRISVVKEMKERVGLMRMSIGLRRKSRFKEND